MYIYIYIYKYTSVHTSIVQMELTCPRRSQSRIALAAGTAPPRGCCSVVVVTHKRDLMVIRLPSGVNSGAWG